MDTTRVSDADRERTAEQLRAAVGAGRLDLTEFDERLRRVYAAVTAADLVRVTADLPAPQPGTPPAATPDARRFSRAWRSWLGWSAFMVAIWGAVSLAAGELTGFWPAIPITIWAGALLVPMLTGQRTHAGCGTGH